MESNKSICWIGCLDKRFSSSYVYVCIFKMENQVDMEREYIYSNNEDKALYIVESYSTGYAS
ncbi:MAG: hypothetical protein RSD90_06480, partial [Anaerovoracaceae bacterium]